MKKTFFLFFFLFFLVSYSYSRDWPKLWGGIEIGYGITLSDNGGSYDVSYGGNNNMYLNSMRAVIGYYILPKLSVGAGIGINSYTDPELSIVPVWFDIRYHPFPNKKIQLNGDFGYTLFTSENDRKGKLLADFSIGYQLINFKRVSIIPAIGYDLCNYSIEETKRFNQSKHSLFLKIGVLFK